MPTTAPTYTILTADRLIDARGGAPIENGAVLLDGSTIAAVGRAADIRPPEGAPAQATHYAGCTILPGMVDCHTHHNGFGDGRLGDDLSLLLDEILTVRSARNARASLFSGVTTIRENGPKNVTMFRLRDAINEGLAIGPRMVLCGHPVAIIGGHMGYFGGEVTGANDARALTRQLIKEGADYIKIVATGGTTRTSFPTLPSFNIDELRAVTAEARKFGKLTATHSSNSAGIANSLDAGVDMIIHCYHLDADGTVNFREDIAERIERQGAFVNPTLQVSRATAWDLTHKRDEQGLTAPEQSELETARANLDVRLDHTRRMIDMGVKVITGSDSSWSSYQLGNTVYETELLVHAGYTPMQGVLSVTSWAADALGVSDTVGTLEPGKAADVLIVRGNPAADINALWNVEDVFLAGSKIKRGSDDSIAAVRQPPAQI
ncbi:MAG: amidohydrolase family protein [Chloroflexi bacterium]|nr:amidohydrolase family protein [Chloroflexota bacterium]